MPIELPRAKENKSLHASLARADLLQCSKQAGVCNAESDGLAIKFVLTFKAATVANVLLPCPSVQHALESRHLSD